MVEGALTTVQPDSAAGRIGRMRGGGPPRLASGVSRQTLTGISSATRLREWALSTSRQQDSQLQPRVWTGTQGGGPERGRSAPKEFTPWLPSAVAVTGTMRK